MGQALHFQSDDGETVASIHTARPACGFERSVQSGVSVIER